MDIKQLKYFIAAAEEQQMTRAAQRLYMAQPPLSRQISLLEQELGLTLFVRKSHSLRLTDEGKVLYRKAKSLLQQMEEMVLEVQETHEGLRGTISVGSLISTMPTLAKEMAFFRRKYPDVTFKIWEDIPAKLIELLEERTIEVALVRTPTFDGKNFAVATVCSEQFYAVIPASIDKHPEKSTITLRQLEELPLVLLHSSPYIGYNELILAEFQQQNLSPTIVCQCDNSAAALLVVMQGIGVTIQPELIATALEDPRLHAKLISDFSTNSNLSVVWDDSSFVSKNVCHLLRRFGVPEERINWPDPTDGLFTTL